MMQTMYQRLVVTQEMQRFGSAEMLRRVVEAVERSECEVEINSIELVLRHEHLEMLDPIVIDD